MVENLGFDDAHAIGRETMGRGQRGKRFRRDAAGIPTAKFKGRLVAMASRMGIAVIAVDPAYTSRWGEEHWKKPLSTEKREVSRHEAAAIVIGRCSLRLRARRRGVPFKGLGKPAPDRGHSPKRCQGSKKERAAMLSQVRRTTSPVLPKARVERQPTTNREALR